MNKESVTNRLRPGIRPGIRLGLSAAIIAGLTVFGAGALDAGAAGAATTGGGGTVITPPPSCPSTMQLSSTYGYTYVIATGQILSLSGSGCSTSSNPVTITLPTLFNSAGVADPQDTVTPSCPVSAPLDCHFSFTYSLGICCLYVTQAEAAAAWGYGIAFPVQFVAKQPVTGASSTLNFSLWDGVR